MPIVLGGVWTVSSVVGWGIAAWKRWCGDKREESDEAQIQRLIKEYGGGDADGDMI